MGLADEMMMSAVSADNHSPAEAEVHKQQGQPPENNSSKLMSSSSASTDITAIKAAAKEEVLKSSSGGTTTFTAAAAAAPPTPLGLNNGSSSAHSPSFGNSRADVSSEDIDVMSTPQRSDLLNGGGPGGGEDEVGIVKPDLESSPTRHIVGINSVLPVNSNGMLVKKEAPTPTHTSEHSGPEPDLAARLKRFKTVVLGALFKHSKSVAFRYTKYDQL